MSSSISAVTFLYLIAWNVDFSIIFGNFGSSIVSVGRWLAILSVFGVFFFLLIRDGLHRLHAVFLLAAVLIPSVILSNDIRYSTIEYVRSLSLFALFYICASRRSIQVSESAILGIFATIFTIASFSFIEFSAIYNIIDVFGGDSESRHRSVGIATHPNTLSVSAIVALYFWLPVIRPQIYLLRIFRISIIVLSTLCCLAAGSRTGVASLVLAFVVYFFPLTLQNRDILRSRRLVLSIVFLLVSTPAYIAWTSPEVDTGFVDNSAVFSASNEARLALWQRSLRDFGNNSIFGVGFGLSFNLGYNEEYKDDIVQPFAHNGLLNFARGSGLLGVVFYMFLVYYLVLKSIRVTYYIVKLHLRDLFFNTYMHVGIIFNLIIFSVVDGAFQNLYGINAILAIALSGLIKIERRIISDLKIKTSLIG